MPGYQAKDRTEDDFECFLEEHFIACTRQQTATRFSEPRSDVTASTEEQSTMAQPGSRSQFVKSQEQRRKTNNRAAQKQWREKQKVGTGVRRCSGLRTQDRNTHNVTVVA